MSERDAMACEFERQNPEFLVEHSKDQKNNRKKGKKICGFLEKSNEHERQKKKQDGENSNQESSGLF